MIMSFLGGSDANKHIEHTEELLAASREARTKLPELRKAFNAGLQPGEYIEVKAPFQTLNGGDEWMWVEVTVWKGDSIKGILDNDPEEVPYLHAGQVVEVKEKDVFDYLHHYPDKHTEGNTTGQVIDKMDANTQLHATTPMPNPCGPE